MQTEAPPQECIVLKPAKQHEMPLTSPVVTVTRRTSSRLPDMTVAVRFNQDYTETLAFFSAEHARRIGQALIAQADAVDAAQAKQAAA